MRFLRWLFSVFNSRKKNIVVGPPPQHPICPRCCTSMHPPEAACPGVLGGC